MIKSVLSITVFLFLSVSGIFASDFIKQLQKASDILTQSYKFTYQKKTIKVRKLKRQGVDVLNKTLKPNTIFEVPDNCLFERHVAPAVINPAQRSFQLSCLPIDFSAGRTQVWFKFHTKEDKPKYKGRDELADYLNLYFGKHYTSEDIVEKFEDLKEKFKAKIKIVKIKYTGSDIKGKGTYYLNTKYTYTVEIYCKILSIN